MFNYAYHPDTSEYIKTNTPAPWMAVTTVAPPAFDPAISGCFWKNGAWAIVTASPDLVKLVSDAQAAIDAQAGVTRAKYITAVTGQSETYQAKANDAAAYKAAGYPSANIANYMWVQAEAKAIYGATPTALQYQAAADGIAATQAQWGAVGSSIEQQRRAGKIAAAAATTAAAAQSARDAAITALKAL